MSSSDNIYLSVIIPAYNEERRIVEPLSQVADYFAKQSYNAEIICVNDGSTDGTAQVLKRASENCSMIRIITYQTNHGKGYAVKQGVLEAKGSYVLFSDADLNTPIEEVERLLGMLNGHDIAIGSRGGRTQKRPLIREIGSRSLNLAIRMLAVPGIKDTQCGFKLFKSEIAKKIFSLVFLEGFSFDIEVLYLARRLGYKVVEVPVVWFYRGGSKVHPVMDGLRFLRDILRIRRHNYDLGDSKAVK